MKWAAALFAASLAPGCTALDLSVHGRSAHQAWRRRKQGAEVDTDAFGWSDQEDVDANKEALLAERDDLRAQLATKNKEFLEQHRRADRLSHQVHVLEGRLHAERLKEKTDEEQLAKAQAALQRISAEATAATASAAAAATSGAAEDSGSSTSPKAGAETLAAPAATSVRSPTGHPSSVAGVAAEVPEAQEQRRRVEQRAASTNASATAAIPALQTGSSSTSADEASLDKPATVPSLVDVVSLARPAAFAETQASFQRPQQQQPQPPQQVGTSDNSVFLDIEAQLKAEDERIDAFNAAAVDGSVDAASKGSSALR